MSRTLVVGLLLALHASVAVGQVKPNTPPADGWQTVFFESPNVAIPLLTAAAIQHSAQLRALDLDKNIGQQELKLTKKSVLSAVALGGTYNYGNLASITLADPNNPNQFNTYSSTRYSAGVNVALPLDRLVSQGTLVKKQQLIIARSEALRQDQENALRQQIIPLYQNVVLARKVLALRQEAYVTVQTTYRLAEKQFRQGQLSLPDLSSVNAQLTDVGVAQETARSQYDTAFRLLEEVVGTEISTLMTTTR